MKIALVLDDTLDTTDGVQQYVLGIGGWLSEQGHEVHYIVGQTTRTDIPHLHVLSRNVQVRFNGNRMSMPWPASRRQLHSLLAQEKFDIVHVQVPYSPFMAGRLLRALPQQTAVIGTFHILPYTRLVVYLNRVLATVNRSSGKRFTRMVAVSAPAQAFARKVYRYDTTVLPNPIRVQQFMRGTIAHEITNSAQSTALAVAPTIVYLGRLVPRKGVLQLLEAIVYLRAQQLYTDPIRVYIGGKGPLLPQLKAFVQTHALESIVQFAGFIAEADKPAFLSRADLAIYPSLAGESFGIVLLEAMAAAPGVVLAGNNPGYASVMQPYPDQLFNPGNTKTFAELLARYLRLPAARAAAAQQQQVYVQRFDIAPVGQALLAIYREALQSRTKS